MKFSKIFALVLAIMMILPFIASCGKEQNTVTFTNVTIQNAYVAPAEETVTGEAAESADDEAKEPTVIFEEELEVPAKEEGVAYTVQDVIEAYGNVRNEDVSIESNKLVKIGDVSRGGGYFWNIQVNGVDAGLTTEVKPEDKIVFTFTNEKTKI